MITLIGLGNPTEEYYNTRHNLGHFVIDTFVSRYNLNLKSNRNLKCRLVKTKMYGKEIILAKTSVFVNNSGESVKKIIEYYNISLDHILIIIDDFSLSIGKIRLRLKGSSGGHKGLQSIIDVLGTEKFPRLKLGIGPVPVGVDPKDFVLSEFLIEEKPIIEKMVNDSIIMIEDFIKRIDT